MNRASTGQAASPRAALLDLYGITRSFGALRANDDVSLSITRGEKHALLGENGAGKSTLVKIVYGALAPDAGEIRIDGVQVAPDGPAAARRLGIGMVFQHFSSFDALTVAENLAVALPEMSRGAIRRELAALDGRFGLTIDPGRRVATLSAGEKQRVEIVRCLLQKPRLLIMDEPTSVLTPQEAQGLFETLDRLSAEGLGLLYITHRLQEVVDLCDRATVLRRGRVVGTAIPREVGAGVLAEMMIGETPVRPERAAVTVGEARLTVENLSLTGGGGTPLRDVSLTARRGEILGIAGVAGEGQDTLFAALSGEQTTRAAGAIRFDDVPVGELGPSARRRLGAAFVPEQRLGHSALGEMRLAETVRLTHYAVRGLPAPGAASRIIRERFDVRAQGSDPYASSLSGGNLQKFVIGREILRDPDILVVAQPTWGVDAGAATVIHAALLDLRARGAAIVVISQDLDEIFALADRVSVLHHGRLSTSQPVEAMTPESIGLLMGGIAPGAPVPEDAHV